MQFNNRPLVRTLAASALVVATTSAQPALDYVKTRGDLVQLTDTYTTEQSGEAVLTCQPGEMDVQKSVFDWRSCQIENTGDKRIAAVYIDLTSAIIGDVVFDDDGSGGDDIAKELSHDWGTTETNPVPINQYQWKWRAARSSLGFDPTAPFNAAALTNVDNLFVDELSDSFLGGAGGYRGALILFGDFDGGETYEFSADMDPNSIAGLQVGTASIDAEWDVGGVSGAEMINAVVTVLFGDGSTASGTIAADGSQAGGVAVVADDLLAAPALTVASQYTAGASGSYITGPSVVVAGTAGSTVRVTMVRGFDPVDSVTPLAGGKITAEALVKARLQAQYPTFPVNNARQLQHAMVVIPGSGSVDVTSSFQFIGQDALAFTAVVVDAAGSGFPLSRTTSPIKLVYAGAIKTCPAGKKFDPSGYCVDSGCNSDLQCPANAMRIPDRMCYNTFHDCQCLSGFFKSGEKCIAQGSCPSGQKKDGSGFCVESWCTDNYQCPANALRIANRQCYNNFDDCECTTGYRKSTSGSQCVKITTTTTTCPSGQRKDGSGYCVMSWCTANYKCPSGMTRIPGRECYDSIHDCK